MSYVLILTALVTGLIMLMALSRTAEAIAAGDSEAMFDSAAWSCMMAILTLGNLLLAATYF